MKLSLNYWSDASMESVTITILGVETRITSRAPALCCAGDELAVDVSSAHVDHCNWCWDLVECMPLHLCWKVPGLLLP